MTFKNISIAHILLPGINLRILGPIFRKLRYPTILSSSLCELKNERSFFTTGGGPDFSPGFEAMLNDPARV